MATAVMPRCLVTIHACDGDPLSPTRDHVTTLMQCLCTQVAIHPRGQVSVLVNKCDFLSLGEVASSCGSRRVASAVKPRHLRLRHDHLCCQRCLVVAVFLAGKCSSVMSGFIINKHPEPLSTIQRRLYRMLSNVNGPRHSA